MVAKIPSAGKGLAQRTGSSGGLVAYLEKEVQGQWFSLDREDVPAAEVTQTLDRNMRHIGSDPEKLRAYTRAAMEQYAANFGKGIEGKDLVYFAKVEHERTTGPADRAVQLGDVEKGQAKEGPQTHIHVIVSRTENLARYAERKKSGELDRKNPYHLSPLTNHKDTQRGVVQGGFERKQYSERVEQAFDRAFAYERPLTETFRYAHTMQHGTPEQCAALRVQAIQEQQAAEQRQAVQQVVAAEQRQVVPLAAPAAQARPPLTPAAPEQAPAPKQERIKGPSR
jgi:hypothetical protein